MTGAEDEDWRTELEEARKDLPPTFASSDTVAADDLLAH
jgi:hypothetical protein